MALSKWMEMKYGLEVADGWLNSLSSMWRRVAFFWGFVAGVGWASYWVLGGEGMGESMEWVLKLGGLTGLLIGPAFLWAVPVAAVTWVRLIHLETAGVRAFLLLGGLIAMNGWLGERVDPGSGKFWLVQVGALVMTVLAVWWPRLTGEDEG